MHTCGHGSITLPPLFIGFHFDPRNKINSSFDNELYQVSIYHKQALQNSARFANIGVVGTNVDPIRESLVVALANDVATTFFRCQRLSARMRASYGTSPPMFEPREQQQTC